MNAPDTPGSSKALTAKKPEPNSQGAVPGVSTGAATAMRYAMTAAGMAKRNATVRRDGMRPMTTTLDTAIKPKNTAYRYDG